VGFSAVSKQHDAQLDYYGRRLATCASDKTVRVFEIDAGNQRLIETLRQHEGPVWQVAWSHPRLGSYLASCSYDSQVIIWAEFSGRWEAVCYHRVHEASGKPASQRTRKEVCPCLTILTAAHHTCLGRCQRVVNAIAWAPHEFGAILACASSDGKVSTVSQNPDGTWESSKPFAAHSIGCNAVSWAPAIAPALGSVPGGAPVKRIATGGCDNLVKIWR